MSGWKKILMAAVVMSLAAPVAAQQEERRAEAAVEAAAAPRAAPDAEGAEAIEVQMREAEERLAEAAARVAELSSSRLPLLRMHRGGHPVMGVTVGAAGRDGPVEGVRIDGVSPGSAAAEAGLRAGDVITSINGEAFTADSGEEAGQKLLDFMSGVEEGDALDVEYLREGRTATAVVRPRVNHEFAFREDRRFRMPAAAGVPVAPLPPDAPRFFNFYAGGGSWGDMEMVSLTEGLGRYFGTTKGLLIVRAPKDENLKLRDGDVIQRIDGREPSSVSHAMRILASYQSGESLEIEIMRDKRSQTVAVEMPDHRQSELRSRAPAVAAEPGRRAR